MDRKHGFRLGSWEVRPLTGEISGSEGTLHVEPKVMEVLVVLAEHAREVVERDDLLRRVWGPRAAVADEPLTRCIAELRRALGDSRQTPVYIQTIPKRGYRLLMPVLELAADGPEPTPQPTPDAPAPRAELTASRGLEPTSAPTPVAAAPQRLRRPTIMAVSLAGLSVLVAFGVVSALRDTAPDPTEDAVLALNAIAVLPFADVSDSSDAGYFGEGLADEIRSRLSELQALRVVARTSSSVFGDSKDDARTIGARLRVAHVLEGSVRRSGDRVRIRAVLIDTRLGYEVWSKEFDGVLTDIFALQDQIANAIVAKLRDSAAVPANPPIATRAATADVRAYDVLLRGRYWVNKRDEDSLRRGVRLFKEAIDRDPSFGAAYVELAKAYVLLPSYSAEVPDEMFDLALATLATGMDHDRTIDEPMQSVLALIAAARWDWPSAGIAFKRALERSPTDPDVLVWYSEFLASVGRLAESAELAQRASETDPLSAVASHRLSVSLMWNDRDAEARRYAQIAEELGMGPLVAPDSYVVMKLRAADYAAVRPMLIGAQVLFARPTEWVDPLLDALASPARKPEAIAALTRAEQARDIARKYLFASWVYLGESERAVTTGLELVQDRPSFKVEFLFSREARTLRASPRFGELLRAIGLTRYWDQTRWPDFCERQGAQIVCH